MFDGLGKTYGRLDLAIMPVKSWDYFVKALSLVFLAYWLHLSRGLNDWLGRDGFHALSPAALVFKPLPSPWPWVLWWTVSVGAVLLLARRTVAVGCVLAGSGFFYATICDPASVGALNMHFLFALAVIFWSSGLQKRMDVTMSAWPAYLIRLYLAVVYFGSGWRKAIYGNWLNDPQALFHGLTGYFTTGLTRWLYPATPWFVWTTGQYLTVVFELGAPLLLLHPSFRKAGAGVGCLLHLGIAFFMKDLFYFSLQMLTFYIPVLIPTSWPTAAWSRSDHQSAI